MPVLLLNEESIRLTEAAIDSLGDVNLIIVDDASQIGGGFLRSKADTYIRNKERLGFAKSVNKGLKLSEGLTAIVNNDIIVSPNWQEVVRDIFKNADEFLFSVHLRMTDYGIPFTYGDKTWITGKERWCQASFFVINKRFYFDERFKYSYDDWDYFIRARERWNTAYTNRACFQHHHSFTRKQLPDLSNEDREYFKKKHRAYPEEIFLKLYPEQMKVDWKQGFL